MSKVEAYVLEKPRVLMIGKFFPPVRGGMEEYVHGLAEAIADDVDLTVLVHAEGRRSSRDVLPRYRVIRAGTWFRAASQPVSPGLFTAVARERYDVVHIHAPNPLAVLAVATLGGKARIIVTHHADMVGFGLAGRVAAAQYRRLLARAEAVTVLSLKNRDRAADVKGVDVPFVALPAGLDPIRFARTPEGNVRAAAIRAELPATACVFAFVGRLVPYKGIDVLIEAATLIPDAICLVVGDGPERVRLEALAISRGVAGRVRFLGAQDDAGRLAVLHAADAFVLPSVSTAEAFGIVQVEAQLCSLPVIAPDLPTGVTEVTTDGVTGLIVPPRDAVALAAAMVRLRDDPNLRLTLGVAGRRRALERYTIDAVRRTAVDIYRGAHAAVRA